MSTSADSGKKYHLQCTGAALETVQAHSKDAPIMFFGACFCPFVQRAWICFEFFGVDYQYYEVDPYAKPKELLEVSPKGLVPGLRLNSYSPVRALNESTVIMEYLEDLAEGSLFPPKDNPYAIALVRLQADLVNRTLIPAFYRYLQATELEKQIEGAKEYKEALEHLVQHFERAEREGEWSAVGLWSPKGTLSWTDVTVYPWLLRTTNVLKHYRGSDLGESPRFKEYIKRLSDHPAIKATNSTDELYLDSYERYAFNRPNTSQVANAINSGRSLP